MALSEATGFVALNNQLDGTQFTLTDYPTPPDAASGRPRRLEFTAGQSRLDLQVNVSQNLTDNELTADYVTAQLGRTNQIIFFSSDAVTNLRVMIENVSPGAAIPVKFIPSRSAWEAGTGGLDFTPGGELLLDTTDSPMVFGPNRTLRITIRKNTGTLLGSDDRPAVAVSFQPGRFIESADVRDVPTTVTALTDTPATAGTDGQILQWSSGSLINAAAPQAGIRFGILNTFFPGTITGLEIGAGLQASLIGSNIGRISLSSTDPSITNWSHADLPTGRIPQATHTWYRHTGAANVVRDMPTTAGLSTGWHAWISNDTTDTTVTLRGAFGGNITQLILAEQEGCYLSWNGSQFVEGARRDRITTSNLANWQANPLIPGNGYVTRTGIAFNAGGSSLNMEANGVTADMQNRQVCVQAPGAYRIDVPTLAAENRADIPVNAAYGFANNGGGLLTIAPRSVDEIAMGSTRYRGQSPMVLAFGAAVTFVRTNDNLWTVTSSTGTITGGV